MQQAVVPASGPAPANEAANHGGHGTAGWGCYIVAISLLVAFDVVCWEVMGRAAQPLQLEGHRTLDGVGIARSVRWNGPQCPKLSCSSPTHSGWVLVCPDNHVRWLQCGGG